MGGRHHQTSLEMKMPCLVSLTEKGLFIFRFGCKEDLVNMLSLHPQSIGKRKIHLVQWSPGLIDIPLPKNTAVWVRLRNVPYHLWCSNIFQALAKAVGTPICLDVITASQKFLAYARVLVEVDLSKELPSIIWIDLEGGNPIGVSVEYENVPCSSCLTTGHKDSFCPQKPGKIVPPPTKFPLKSSSPPTKLNEVGILGPAPPEFTNEITSIVQATPDIPHHETEPFSVPINPFELLELFCLKEPSSQPSPSNSRLPTRAVEGSLPNQNLDMQQDTSHLPDDTAVVENADIPNPPVTPHPNPTPPPTVSSLHPDIIHPLNNGSISVVLPIMLEPSPALLEPNNLLEPSPVLGPSRSKPPSNQKRVGPEIRSTNLLQNPPLGSPLASP